MPHLVGKCCRRKGRFERSVFADRAPQVFRAEILGLLLPCSRRRISGPLTPSGNPGKFSTMSESTESWPPGSWPTTTRGFAPASGGINRYRISGTARAYNDDVFCTIYGTNVGPVA